MDHFQLVYAHISYAESYNKAVDQVARERRFLATTKGFPIESTKQFVSEIVRQNWAQYYVLVDSIVVGWCDIVPKSFEGLNHVGTLGMGVVKEHRHRGFGRILIEKTLDHARIVSCLEKVELEVFERNTAAVQFYEKAGFVPEGLRKKARKLDGQYDNLLLMAKFLIS